MKETSTDAHLNRTKEELLMDVHTKLPPDINERYRRLMVQQGRCLEIFGVCDTMDVVLRSTKQL
jgi:hypothetical protein